MSKQLQVRCGGTCLSSQHAELEAGGLDQGYPCLQIEFEASLGYVSTSPLTPFSPRHLPQLLAT